MTPRPLRRTGESVSPLRAKAGWNGEGRFTATRAAELGPHAGRPWKSERMPAVYTLNPQDGGWKSSDMPAYYEQGVKRRDLKERFTGHCRVS